MPRTQLSIQWHKVLAWLHARSQPNYYERLAPSQPQASAIRPNQQHLLFAPSDWFSQHPPTALPSLARLTRPEVLAPTSLASRPPPDSGAKAQVQLLPERQSQRLVCAVCNVTARGVIVACPLCHHGGHMEHLSAWWHRRKASTPLCCPASDCDCACDYLGSIGVEE